MTDRAKVKVQLRYDTFTSDFLRPLLAGGTVHIGRAIPLGMLDHFSLARPSSAETEHAILECLHAEASEIAPVRVVPFPDRGVAAVAMAVHDLLLVTDPSLDRAFARGARPRILEWADALLDAAGAPSTRGAALARHAIVHRALSLEREDVTVKNWAYTYRFFGRPVPPRVVSMPRLRLVKKESSRVPAAVLWQGLDATLDTMSRVRGLLARSPVTELLHAGADVPLVPGAAALAVLSDDLVRNGIAQRLVAFGGSVMTRYGAALERLAASGAPPRVLYFLVALVYEALVTSVLDARGDTEPVFGRPRDAHAALFCAILPAVLGAPGPLTPFLDLSPVDLQRLRERAVVLDGQAGPEIAARAVALVERAALPRLDHEREGAGGRAGGLAS